MKEEEELISLSQEGRKKELPEMFPTGLRPMLSEIGTRNKGEKLLLYFVGRPFSACLGWKKRRNYDYDDCNGQVFFRAVLNS